MKSLLCAILVFSSIKIYAFGVFYTTGQDIVKVVDLPDNDGFKFEVTPGKFQYFDLGILHEQFSIFGIPIWNYGEKSYVLYKDDIYYELDEDWLDAFREENVNIPMKPKLPFWDVYGGKLLVFLFLLAWVGYMIIKPETIENGRETD